MRAFPDALEITPRRALDLNLAVPGSKSITNRALIVAALAGGTTRLHHALVAEDSEVMVRALRALGFTVVQTGEKIELSGQGGRIPATEADLDLRLSGTSIRFLAAMLSLGLGHYRLDGNARMRERPIGDLLQALNALGASAYAEFANDCPPVILEASGLRGGRVAISGAKSSQFLSALLLAAPYASAPVEISVVDELQSKPYVDVTLKLMEDFGVAVGREGYARFTVTPARYQARDYDVEGDASAAAYFWAAAAISGGRARVSNVGLSSSQGDKRLADVLGEMGCWVTWDERSCTVAAPADGVLRGGSFDLNDIPDQAQTLAVVALFADRPVHISNVANLRLKETDRLAALGTELARLGARVEEGPDWLRVHPLAQAPQHPVAIDTYGDHRMAMAFTLAGLRLPGVVINDPGCVSKTFPTFFEAFGMEPL